MKRLFVGIAAVGLLGTLIVAPADVAGAATPDVTVTVNGLLGQTIRVDPSNPQAMSTISITVGGADYEALPDGYEVNVTVSKQRSASDSGAPGAPFDYSLPRASPSGTYSISDPFANQVNIFADEYAGGGVYTVTAGVYDWSTQTAYGLPQGTVTLISSKVIMKVSANAKTRKDTSLALQGSKSSKLVGLLTNPLSTGSTGSKYWIAELSDSCDEIAATHTSGYFVTKAFVLMYKAKGATTYKRVSKMKLYPNGDGTASCQIAGSTSKMKKGGTFYVRYVGSAFIDPFNFPKYKVTNLPSKKNKYTGKAVLVG